MPCLSLGWRCPPRKGLRFEDFRILRVLGKGSGGIVHLAEHVPTGRLVAMKTVSFMSSEGGDDDRGVGADGAEKPSRMVSELLALDATGHCENVVAFYGAFFVDGATRILLEYMDAGSLKDLLVHGPIPMNVLGAIAEQVLHGLVYLHSRHLIHRGLQCSTLVYLAPHLPLSLFTLTRMTTTDIKPGNLLVNTQGQVKIADFGVSDRKEHTLSTCHSIIGTVTYMSPERIDAQPYKIDSDVWSFGLVILECATGEYPYKTALLRGGRNRTLSTLEIMEQIVRGPAPQAPESMPASFRAFIAACLQREPAKRAPARALLEHPWILECQRHGASVEAWVSSTLGQEFDF